MLNIAKHMYAGWSSTKVGLQEAEIIPNGESANEKKKIASFTKKYTFIKEFENVPLPGFTLAKSGKKTWSSTDTTWQIIDPRGFMVRITSDNLERILQVTGITENLIQQRCVWAREDSQTRMTLVPVTADVYEQAVENTKMLEEKVSITDVQIGDTVFLQNKMQGRYMGTLSLYGRIEGSYNDYDIMKVRPQLRRQIIEIEPGRYYCQVNAKILKVIDKVATPLTKEESAEIIQKEIDANNAVFVAYDWLPSNPASHITSYMGEVKFVSADAQPIVKLTCKEITLQEAKSAYNTLLDESDRSLILEDANGTHFLIDFLYDAKRNGSADFHTNELVDFDPTEKVERFTRVPAPRGSYNWNTIAAPARRRYTLDNFTKFYIITKHVKKSTYI